MSRRVLRRGSKKVLSRGHLEGRSTPCWGCDALGVCPVKRPPKKGSGSGFISPPGRTLSFLSLFSWKRQGKRSNKQEKTCKKQGNPCKEKKARNAQKSRKGRTGLLIPLQIQILGCESGRLAQNGKRAEIQKWKSKLATKKSRKWPSARNGGKMAQD